MPRFTLGLEYDGSAHRGWQAQRHARGIQPDVEAALSRVADHPIEVTAAGRTDAGVHACIQVIHFDASAERTGRSWVLGANANLPAEVSALWARAVPSDFHARYSALARTYRYLILNRPSRPAISRQYVAWVREPLDAGRMHEAAQRVVGEHDFSSFRAAECQSASPIRHVCSIAVRRDDAHVAIEVTANAFLQHMVRNLAGVLIAIGRGTRTTEWITEVLEARDRRCGGVTAPPQGLYLIGIRYPASLDLPSEPGRY
jgi:tRNA pseudouridine38-40 synthase